MRRYLIILPLLLMTLSLQAQRIKAYVSGGFTASQIEGDELKGFDKWGGFYGVGAMASLSENNRWKLGVEANYATRGSKNTSGNPYSIRLPLRYVDIPVSFYYHDPKGGMTFGLGLTYGRLVQQPHDTIAFGEAFVPDTNNLHFNTNDLCLHVEARFQVWQWIFFSLRYQRSLIPINEWSFTENGETWTNKCFNKSIQGRLIFQFGDPNEDYRGHHRGRSSSYKHRRR